MKYRQNSALDIAEILVRRIEQERAILPGLQRELIEVWAEPRQGNSSAVNINVGTRRIMVSRGSWDNDVDWHLNLEPIRDSRTWKQRRRGGWLVVNSEAEAIDETVAMVVRLLKLQ